MKKIMFNDRYGLTEAVLSGRKTQTRRIVSEKLWDRWTDYDDFCNSIAVGSIPTTREYYDEMKFFLDNSPYKVGEVVAVAQSYKDSGYSQYALNRAPKTMEIRGPMGDSAGWNNKMFVRADACKHRIRITNVRVEHLQDISDEDCIAEGVIDCSNGIFNHYAFTENPNIPRRIKHSPREAYAALIDKIYGKGIWKSNPWCLVYDFELAR